MDVISSDTNRWHYDVLAHFGPNCYKGIGRKLLRLIVKPALLVSFYFKLLLCLNAKGQASCNLLYIISM